MRDSIDIPEYRVVIVTLDNHAAGPCLRVLDRLTADFPGLQVSVHAAAEWSENPAALDAARAAVLTGDIIIANLLFIEEHVQAILPVMRERRDHCDAMLGVVADTQLVRTAVQKSATVAAG